MILATSYPMVTVGSLVSCRIWNSKRFMRHLNPISKVTSFLAVECTRNGGEIGKLDQ
jgi:hypothetical protein